MERAGSPRNLAPFYRIIPGCEAGPVSTEPSPSLKDERGRGFGPACR